MCGTQGHVKEWLRGKGRNDKKAAVVLLVEEGFGCWGGEEGEEEQAPNINQNKRKNNKAKVFAFKDMVPVVPACCLLLGVVVGVVGVVGVSRNNCNTKDFALLLCQWGWCWCWVLFLFFSSFPFPSSLFFLVEKELELYIVRN